MENSIPKQNIIQKPIFHIVALILAATSIVLSCVVFFVSQNNELKTENIALADKISALQKELDDLSKKSTDSAKEMDIFRDFMIDQVSKNVDFTTFTKTQELSNQYFEDRFKNLDKFINDAFGK